MYQCQFWMWLNPGLPSQGLNANYSQRGEVLHGSVLQVELRKRSPYESHHENDFNMISYIEEWFHRKARDCGGLIYEIWLIHLANIQERTFFASKFDPIKSFSFTDDEKVCDNKLQQVVNVSRLAWLLLLGHFHLKSVCKLYFYRTMKWRVFCVAMQRFVNATDIS